MDSQTRQEYVGAAVSFLQNPKLVDSSLKDKLKFLRDKGLSEVEVDEALNLALINRHQSQNGRWNFLIILGLCIGGYKLYQAYLESKSSEKQQKSSKSKPTIDSTIASKNIQGQGQSSFVDDQPTLSAILDRMMELKRLLELQRTNFGAEMQSLKTLLLGHEKFAAPPKIPEWQLKDNDKEAELGGNEKDLKRKKNEKKNSREGDVQSTSSGFIEPSVIVPNLG